MRLFVLGATGKTGTEILQLARARGHEVTAFVRSPHKLTPAPSLTIVRGDPREEAAIAAALPGHDAVLSALGAPPRQAFSPHTLVGDCAKATVGAMTKAGLGRLLLVSAAVLFPEKGLSFAFFRWFLQHIASDLRAAEEALQSSGLDWTIARPPRLTRSPEVTFRALSGGLPKGGSVTSFRAVATFLLDAAEQHGHSREIVGLAR